jgi:hypothetical protein
MAGAVHGCHEVPEHSLFGLTAACMVVLAIAGCGRVASDPAAIVPSNAVPSAQRSSSAPVTTVTPSAVTTHLATPTSGLSLTRTERRTLDSFLTSFSQARVTSFAEGAAPDETLVRFAIAHQLLTDWTAVENLPDGVSGALAQAAVDASAFQYFGSTPDTSSAYAAHAGLTRIGWEHGRYTFRIVTSVNPPFTKVTTVARRADGALLVRATVYQPASAVEGVDFAGLSIAAIRSRAGVPVNAVASVSAVLRRTLFESRPAYRLVAYYVR